MRIGIYLEQYEPGGVDTHLLTLLRNWKDPSDRFTLFVNKDHRGLKTIEDGTKNMGFVEIVRYPSKSYHSLVTRKSRNPLYKLLKLFARVFFWRYMRAQYRQAKRLLKKYPVDALISDNGGYPAGWGVIASIFAAKKLGIPKRVFLIHHAAVKPERKTEKWVDKQLEKSATDLAAVSLATRKTLIDFRYFNPEFNPIRVIYNGVDAPDKNRSAPATDIRKKYGLDKKTILAGMVGRLERYKGQEDLLIAFSKLSPGHQGKMKLVFVGGGDESEKARLKALAERLGISGKVLFTGFLDGNPGDIVSQLDLLCSMTKDFEGFGLTIGEAMVQNVPVLATAVGAIPEYLDDSSAKLVPPESPIAAAQALSDFIENRKKWVLRAETARKVIGQYSGARMSEELDNLIKRY